MTNEQYVAAVEYARALGAEHGENAAGWFEQDSIGGRVSGPARSSENARLILAGIEDGDPEILDALPAPDLSGQWADSLTGPMLISEALAEAGLDVGEYDEASHDAGSYICDAYDRAFCDACEDEVARMCRFVLAAAV